MKKMVSVVEVSGEGLEALMGERVTLFCLNYTYTGKLVGVNASFVKLEDAGVVFETGAFSDKTWKDCQPISKEWYVQTASVESFGLLK